MKSQHDRSFPARDGQRAGFNLWELLVVISILATLAALLLPSVRRGGEAASRTLCRNNLKQIARALHNYHNAYGSFPPQYTVDADGRPLHSWRTLILPFLDSSPRDASLDLSKPWDDPVNAAVFAQMPTAFHCPNLDIDPTMTTYVAVAGPEASFHRTEPRSISDITDGTSNTLLVIEVSPEAAVPWMAPRDGGAEFFQSFGESTVLVHYGGTQAALADGSVRFLSANTEASLRKALITISGKEPVGSF